MRKIILCLLFFVTGSVVFAQDSNKVWDLLFLNKRDEARQLFDKQFKKKMDSDIELLLLDAFIDFQKGKVSYDKTLLEKMSRFEESKNYLYAGWYYPFIMGDVSSEGYDDLAFSRMDFLAQAYSNDPFIIYKKAIFDKKRLNYEGYKTGINNLNSIQKWQFCGVFENINESGINIEYEPEYYAKNDKMFNANSNGKVQWYNPAITQNEGFHFYLNENEYGSGIIYAQVFIESDSDKKVVLNFGASGPLKIFLNDAEIYANDKIATTDLNAYNLSFNLKKGMNRLLIKSSTGKNNDYFYASLTDANKKLPTGINYFDTYQAYQQSSLQEINPIEIVPDFETFLIGKIQSNPNSPLYKILLYDAYMNNRKTEKAFDVLEELTKKYPNSSLLAVKQLDYYIFHDDTQKNDELLKSIEVNDEGYYYNVLNKIGRNDWMKEASLSEIQRYRSHAEKLESKYVLGLIDCTLAIRNSNIDLMLQKVEDMFSISYNNDFYITTFAPLYTSLKKDKEKTMAFYETIIKTRENSTATNSLINYYNSTGRKDEAKKLIDAKIAASPYFNYVYYDAISMANSENNYKGSQSYTDIGLKNFPFSFKLLEQKGLNYNSLQDTKEAEKYFKESLVYNSGNDALRKRLYDIAKIPDEIELVATKDIYSVIKQKRNSKAVSDFGVNVLLDEYIVNVLPEGIRKSKVIYLYEVTTESGIEELKEYNINADELNIIKAEVVRPDGSISPGEENGSTIVFTNLKVNDVVYIEYESTDSGYGRFYKDFTLTDYFNNAYPMLHTIFGIIYPDDVKFAFDVMNGDISSKTSKVGNRNFIKWEKKNTSSIPLSESYSPAYSDTANKVDVSTIKSWSDISNWYADLVKKSLVMDITANRTYNEIFPQGVNGLSQNEIAYKIYKFIEENITYSSLDFRQSGYVPQKPAKTISTKLGDCKDVSTLFVAMAQKAGVKANLVLVQTNENGIKSPKLPSISFNHCIVKVNLDGKDYFLELTDKYLPFKALPISLYNAKALVISFDKTENEKEGIINISFENALKSISEVKTTVNVEDEVKKFTNLHTISGAGKSYYNEIFSDATTEDYRKKELEDNLKSRLDKIILVESSKIIVNEKFKEELKYEIKFSVSEKLQSVGSLKIMQVPYIDKVYTRDIIANEKRNYDIEYVEYENLNEYNTEVIINISEGKKFVEIPQNRELSYKNHIYKITYELVKPNSLKVTRIVSTPWDDIKTTEYAEFKKYVEQVIATEEEILGFK